MAELGAPSPGKAKQETPALPQDGPQELASGWGLGTCSPALAKTEGEMQPQATSSNQAWDISDIVVEVLAGSPVQEAFLFFRVVNKLWLLLYFPAETSQFCLIYHPLLWGEYLQAE